MYRVKIVWATGNTCLLSDVTKESLVDLMKSADKTGAIKAIFYTNIRHK